VTIQRMPERTFTLSVQSHLDQETLTALASEASGVLAQWVHEKSDGAPWYLALSEDAETVETFGQEQGWLAPCGEAFEYSKQARDHEATCGACAGAIENKENAR